MVIHEAQTYMLFEYQLMFFDKPYIQLELIVANVNLRQGDNEIKCRDILHNICP